MSQRAIVPTKREVLRELKREIESWRTSNQDIDGVIRDTDVLHSIRCIEVAVLMVRAYKPIKGRKREHCDRVWRPSLR